MHPQHEENILSVLLGVRSLEKNVGHDVFERLHGRHGMTPHFGCSEGKRATLAGTFIEAFTQEECLRSELASNNKN